MKSIKTNKKSQLEKKLKELTDKKQMMLNYVCEQSGSTERFLFLKLVATHQNSNNIKFIRKGQEFITKRNDVFRELCNFYRELYQSLGVNENKIKTYVYKIYLVNILSDKEKQSFEQFSTINECDKAVTT